MKSAQAVYYGPADSGYPSVGRVSANESVDFLWMEGTWCYIRYSVSGTANKKCGYVPETAVNHANESPLIYNDNNSGDRYIRDGGTTYTGPGSSGYVSAGSVDAGELVAYTGYMIFAISTMHDLYLVVLSLQSNALRSLQAVVQCAYRIL